MGQAQGREQGWRPNPEHPAAPRDANQYSGTPESFKSSGMQQDSRQALGGAVEFTGNLSVPAQPKQVPIVISWTHGGNCVELAGSWDGWSVRVPMQKQGGHFTVMKQLAPGVYQYKFIVDDIWKHAPEQVSPAAWECTYPDVRSYVGVSSHAHATTCSVLLTIIIFYVSLFL